MPAQPPKPGHAHLQIRDVPKSDLRALKVAAALAEPPTTTTQLIRDLIHARVTQAQPGPATGYQYTLRLNGANDAVADALLDAFLRAADALGFQVSASMVKVDDDGNPVP